MLPLSLPYPTPPPSSFLSPLSSSPLYPRYYGPVTSNTNFCETDHQFSRYIAELINTISNLIYLFYGARGLISLSHRHPLTLSNTLPHIGLVLVGLGSALFHSTLQKLPQICDEIGMAIPTGAVVCRLISFDVEDRRKRAWWYWGTAAVVTGVYVVHCVSFSNWIHYPAFAVMVQYVGWRVRALTKQIGDEGVRRKVTGYIRTGRVLFVGAFAVWLVDRLCCHRLNQMREWVGLPWGWLLELHGWWHVGTGMGAFVFIQVAEFLTEDGGAEDPGVRFDPFRLGFGVGGKEEKGGKGGMEDGYGKNKKKKVG